MSHPYDVLTLENGARFIFTPCPGTKDADLAKFVPDEFVEPKGFSFHMEYNK